LLGTRFDEYVKDVEKVCNKKYTRAEKLIADDVHNKSAIADHAARSNHVINWDDFKLIDRKSERVKRWIKEAIWVRKRGEENTLNRNEGVYKLSNIYNPLLQSDGKPGNTTTVARSGVSQL